MWINCQAQLGAKVELGVKEERRAKEGQKEVKVAGLMEN